MATLHQTLIAALRGGNAHATFEKVTGGWDPARINDTLPGVPYSAFALLEHLRAAQRDILDFMAADTYTERAWPDEYWPKEPGTAASWQASLDAFQADLNAVCALLEDGTLDLNSSVKHGPQSHLREILLIIDHNAYHLGELLLLRRALGLWPAR